MLGHLVRGVAIAAVLAVVGYLGVGSWISAQNIHDVLRVGAVTAQSGEGWPVPERPQDIGYSGDPASAFGYGFEAVEIQGDLGSFPAWLVEPRAESSRWAIFIHGIGGRRENGYRFLPVLVEAGLPTLMITYRNDEGAPPAPDGLYAFGLTEWVDLNAAVQYALDNGASDVVLVGESMGGGLVGQFMLQSDLADTVAAIVLDAPAADFGAIVSDQIGRMGLPLAPVLASGGVILSGLMLPVRIGSANVKDVLAEFAGPMFLSHGSADRVVPVAISDSLVKRRTAVTEYLRTEADHIRSWQENPEVYDAALRNFLAAVD